MKVPALEGWRLGCVIFVLGVVSALAMPPVGAWWVLGMSFPLCFVFLAQLRSSHRFAEFRYGWLFGFGYFVAALHWIGFAFFVDAADYLWMMPFAVGALAAGMALFWGVAVAVSLRLYRLGYPLFLVAPACFAGSEWLRGHILTGFPWAVPGLAVDGMGGTAQLVSLIGMNGATLLVVMWALTPLAVFERSKVARWFAVLLAISLPVSWLWGNARLAQQPTSFIPGQIIRLVQPNISQSDKWRGDNAREIFDQLLSLSARPTNLTPTVIVWPESAVPFLIDESVEGQRELRHVLQGTKTLLTGAVRRSAPEAVNGVEPRYYTSILAFDGEAKVIAHYDKKHLVPGGEYLPLAWLIEPLGFRKVVNLPESFNAGLTSSVVTIRSLGPVALQICYEAIFPEALFESERPNWILNVTNDGWFGNSAGPYQHLAQLRLRAIEQGLGVVRVANTGISAIIDATGGYVWRSDIGVVAVFDSPIPKAGHVTVFSTHGDFGLWSLFGILCLGAIVVRRLNKLCN